MDFEVLKRSNLKRNIIIGMVVVLIFSAVILTFTRAKYRVTESVPLVSGTINFSPYDFNVVAMYLNKGDETVSTKKAPHVGYTLNSEQSTCVVDDEEVEGYEILYDSGLLDFNNLSYAGTKCSVYFDLIPDSEDPVINNLVIGSDDTSITVTVRATDNIGVFYYYFQLDDEEEIRIEENTYTFEGLEKDDIHLVSVRVEDAAGNEASSTDEVTVGVKAGDVILASENAPTNSTIDWTGKTTYYYTGKPNNWVQFAGFWWRIIRINGDGSIRIIYQGVADSDKPDGSNETGTGTQIGTKAFNSPGDNNMYVGFKYGSNSSDYAVTHANINNSTVLGADNSNDTTTLNGWYRASLLEYTTYIDGNAGFCGDRRLNSGTGTGETVTTYQPSIRINNSTPNLSCEKVDIYTIDEFEYGNGALTYPIGLISADEAMLGGILRASSPNTYLNTNQIYWTMSPHGFNGSIASMLVVSSSGHIGGGNDVFTTYPGVRPVINIRADVQLTGTGSQNDPFKVVTS